MSVMKIGGFILLAPWVVYLLVFILPIALWFFVVALFGLLHSSLSAVVFRNKYYMLVEKIS